MWQFYFAYSSPILFSVYYMVFGCKFTFSQFTYFFEKLFCLESCLCNVLSFCMSYYLDLLTFLQNIYIKKN